MPNAKDLKSQKKNIIVYGPTGSGKTTLFTTLPGKKFLYIFDPSALDTLRGQDIDYEYFPPDGVLGIRATQKGARGKAKMPEPTSYRDFENHLENFGSNSYEDYDIIGFSSITTLSQILMNRLLFINGRFGHVPELSDYNLLGITLVALFEDVLSVQNKTVFIEGHSDLVQDQVSKKIQNQFDITKNVRRMLPRLLTDAWVAEADVISDKSSFRIHTMPTREWPLCKNSFGFGPFIDVTIDLKKDRVRQGIGSKFS